MSSNHERVAQAISDEIDRMHLPVPMTVQAQVADHLATAAILTADIPPPARRRIGGLDAPEPDGTEDAWEDTRESLVEAAHGLICMVDGSTQGWRQPDDWVQAADRWIARYERVLRAAVGSPVPEPDGEGT